MTLDPPPLDDTDLRILRILAEDGGFSTAWTGKHAGLPTGRAHSAALSRRIRYLERHGLVGRLDEEKPVAWTRTAKGTAILLDPATTNQGDEGR